MNQSTLIKNIHLGIKKTNDLYIGWTGGWWITAYGVENFMVGNVARFIMEQADRPAYAFLEVPFRELYDDGGKLPRGRRSEAKRDRNRLDLSFYNQTGKIQYALEFKKMWTAAGFEHDANRLAGLLNVLGTGKGGSLTCAVFTCLVAANGSSRENTLDKLRSKIETYGERCDGYMTTELGKAVTFYNVTSSLDYKDIGPVLTEDGTQALASLCVRMNNSRGDQE
mgnify:CR=1 FL=1